MLLILRRSGAHRVDPLPENSLLHRQSLFEAGFGRSRRLAFERKRNAPRRQHPVDDMHEIDRPRHADVGNRLIDHLFRFDGRHTHVQRAFEHRPKLGLRGSGNARREDAHHPRLNVEIAVAEYFSERKVIKNFD